MEIANAGDTYTVFVGEQNPEGEDPPMAILRGVEIDFDKREIRSKGRVSFEAGTALRGEVKIIPYSTSLRDECVQ